MYGIYIRLLERRLGNPKGSKDPHNKGPLKGVIGDVQRDSIRVYRIQIIGF